MQSNSPHLVDRSESHWFKKMVMRDSQSKIQGRESHQNFCLMSLKFSGRQMAVTLVSRVDSALVWHSSSNWQSYTVVASRQNPMDREKARRLVFGYQFSGWLGQSRHPLEKELPVF